MNIETASLCADLSRAVYDWSIWEYYLQDKHDQFLSKRIEVSNHEVGLFFKDGTLYIVVRGTEIDSIDDIKINFNIMPRTFAELEGSYVHSGFLKSAKAIWQELKELLDTDVRYNGCFRNIEKIICTGHSLGGAVSTLLSVYINYWKDTPVDLYTFGSPKGLSNNAKTIWDRRYTGNSAVYNQINHYRFVNNNDIVPNLPLNGFVWEHCGNLYYITARGKVKESEKYGFWSKLFDKVKGYILEIGNLKIDGLADHSIDIYSTILKRN